MLSTRYKDHESKYRFLWQPSSFCQGTLWCLYIFSKASCYVGAYIAHCSRFGAMCLFLVSTSARTFLEVPMKTNLPVTDKRVPFPKDAKIISFTYVKQIIQSSTFYTADSVPEQQQKIWRDSERQIYKSAWAPLGSCNIYGCSSGKHCRCETTFKNTAR